MYPRAVGASHVGHAIGWAAGAITAPVVLGTAFGQRWLWFGIACGALATLWLLLWLPRTAHNHFEAARFAKASRRYRFIASIAFTRRRERAALLSRAGCQIASGQLPEAEAALAAIDPGGLDTAERVVWLNNRACVALDTGGDATDALALVEEATALRPDVPSVQHTRAKALLAVGRIDDAIGVLDAMRTGGELPPYLESERCRELARAWERKGQVDYAADYLARARLHAAS
jgi:predicted Zn-dependent protease